MSRVVNGQILPSPEERDRKIVLVSRDVSLLEVVAGVIEPPWNVDIRLDGRSVRRGLVRGVRGVVVDDALLPESERGWLLDQIHRRLPEAVVVYVASRHTAELERNVRAHGVLHYTSKPVDRDRLGRVLAALFGNGAVPRDEPGTRLTRKGEASWPSSTSRPD